MESLVSFLFVLYLIRLMNKFSGYIRSRAHKNGQLEEVVAKHARDRVFYFQYSLIILPGLHASIGVTHSYSSHPFLCALD